MTILDRFRGAIGGWQRPQLQRAQVLPAQRKAGSVIIWPDFRTGKPYQWHAGEYVRYAEEGFNVNSLVYSAISYKVRAQQAAPLRAYSGDPQTPKPLPDAHPLAQLIKRPNDHQSWAEFQGLATVHLNLSGNSYAFIARGPNNQPLSMRLLRPDRVWIMPLSAGGTQSVGYVYVPEGRRVEDGIPFLADDIIHVKLPNPTDPLDGWGMGYSPIGAIAYSGDVDNAVTRFLKVFFDKGTMVSGVLKFEDRLDPEEIAEIKERWAEQYGGVDNWSEIGVLDSQGSYERLAPTFDEMGFETIDERNESRILGPFGVPPILLGTRTGLARSTYSNYGEARRAFWEDTFVPELSLYEVEYQHYLKWDGAWVAFDYSDVPALQEDIPALLTAWAESVRTGLPKSVAADLLGLGIPELPDGDVVYMPMGMQAIGRLGDKLEDLPKLAEALPGPPAAPAVDDGAASDGPDDEPPPDQDAENKALDVATGDLMGRIYVKAGTDRKAVASRLEAILYNHQFTFEAQAVKQFERDQAEILARLTKVADRAREAHTTMGWGNLVDEWDGYLLNDGKAYWNEGFDPLIQKLITAQSEYLASLYKLAFDPGNLFAQQWYNDYLLKFADPICNTTKADLSRMLQQATSEGWGLETTQNRIGLMFKQYMHGPLTEDEFSWYSERMPKYRRELIARTETHRAANGGAFELYKSNGIGFKEWQAVGDDKCREGHLAASLSYRKGGIVGPIRIDEPFVLYDEKGNKHELMWPGDPNAPIGQTANCRCKALPYDIRVVEQEIDQW